MNQQRRLDLERYRRMKARGRNSPASSNVHSYLDGRKKPPGRPQSSLLQKQFVEAPASPYQHNVSDQIVCGMLGSTVESHECLPYAVPETAKTTNISSSTLRSKSTPRARSTTSPGLLDGARRDRLYKFKSRTRQSTGSVPKSRLEINREQIFAMRLPDTPSGAPSISSSVAHIDPPSQLGLATPTSTHTPDNRVGTRVARRQMDPPVMISGPYATGANPGTAMPRLTHSSSSEASPHQPGVTKPESREPSRSRSSSDRDRIEEARDMGNYADSFEEIPFARGLDRIESTRDASPRRNSLQIRSSLEMPSLHSQYSSEAVSRVDSGTNKVPRKEERAIDALARSDRVRPTESRHHYRVSPRELAAKKAVNTPEKQQEERPLYRIESPRPGTPTLDQRTVRLLYSSDFAAMVEQEKVVSKLGDNDGSRASSSGSHLSRSERLSVTFVVRKRPMLESEVAARDFDVVDAGVGHSSSIVVYNTKLEPDLKTKQLTPVNFSCDKAFSENVSSEEFYIRVAQTNVLATKSGRDSLFVIYGGSGSGKTHTMTDLEERVAYDIFETNMSRKAEPVLTRPTVTVQYIELCGNQCFDMLGPVGSFIRVASKERGLYQFKGAESKSATSPRELLSILSKAKRRLATQSSLRKSSHGRSGNYVVCQLKVSTERHVGCLTMLDCGSNWKESIEGDHESIETSFDLLMENIRLKAMGNGQEPLQSDSNITNILKENFESGRSQICLIATVSPNATSTESTIATLSIMERMMGGRKTTTEVTKLPGSPSTDDGSEAELALPRQWSHSELVSWMTRKRLIANPVPPDVNGRFAMRMSKLQLKNTFYDLFDDGKAEKLFAALRAENDRIARLRVKRRIARGIRDGAE